MIELKIQNKSYKNSSMKELTLFPEAPKVYRRSNGRFATKDQADADRQRNENKYLKLEVEKLRRMYLAASKRASRLERVIKQLKTIIS